MMTKRSPKPEVQSPVALSLLGGSTSDGIKTRKIAIVVTSGCDGQSVLAIRDALTAEGAVPRLVGVNLGKASSINSPTLDIEVSMEAAPSMQWDATVIPHGVASVEILSDSGGAKEFLKDQYRHCKPILLLGKAEALINAAGISSRTNGAADPALLVYDEEHVSEAIAAFSSVLEGQRHLRVVARHGCCRVL